MMIDQNKIVEKSKSYSGYKGVLPKFKRPQSRSEQKLRTLRTLIGIAIAVAFAVGLLSLIYSLATEGEKAVSRITQQQSEKSAPQYLEVTFKPKQQKK
jgi:hypothetical protein